MNSAANHYVPPKHRMELWMNGAVAWLTRHGVSLFGSRILRVRGRSTGLWREVPVNPLTLPDGRYLVAPRGHTQWVRNMRVAGEGQLRLGRRVEGFTAVEIGDDEKVGVLREYLRRWKFEVGMFFDGVDAKATDEELLRIAPKHPVFRITPG
jgi:deazaflavin-dependent oxidoreductase (nitroreductase family)